MVSFTSDLYTPRASTACAKFSAEAAVFSSALKVHVATWHMNELHRDKLLRLLPLLQMYAMLVLHYSGAHNDLQAAEFRAAWTPSGPLSNQVAM